MENKKTIIKNVYEIRSFLYGLLTILSFLFLFGSLFLSCVSGDGVYFVFGYPVAGISLILANVAKPKKQENL